MGTIDVYFDYRSPFAYIAAEVMPDFADRTGATLCWKPIDLMKLSNYADGLPYSPLKRRYVAIDAARSADFHGVPIAVPKPHPVLSETALRLAVVSLQDEAFPALHRALFRAAWRDQRDLSSRGVLEDCIRQAKRPAAEWLHEAELDATIECLDATTAEAESRGVFGVPTMCLDNELFWGLDSLAMLQWRLEQQLAKQRGS